MRYALIVAALAGSGLLGEQPVVKARKAETLAVEGGVFRDLNKNGKLDRYEDWRLPFEARVADLIGKMTLEEKVGLMVHASLQGFTGPNGVVLDAPAENRGGGGGGGGRGPAIAGNVPGMSPGNRPSPAEMILKRNVRWMLSRPGGESAEDAARFANGLQEIAEGSRLGIPVMLSSDPRHSRGRGVSAGSRMSMWPEQIGFGAIGDAEVVREFGRIAAREYRAIGLRTALHPMADVATEPRWPRIAGTFGEDGKLTGELVKAYIEGFQGKALGAESVLCVTKHWPGDGPLKDGLDPHNAYGKMQVYPGRNFEYHLMPFLKAMEAGTGAMMPAYGIADGMDRVGMGFSKVMVKDLLRGKYGFDGLVITDWLISRLMFWGVEEQSMKERQRMIVEAGCDQLGGENDGGLLVELVKEGAIGEGRIDESVRRVLRPMFQMGLFENPYVDPELAGKTVGRREHVEAGLAAQRRSIVLLKNGNGLLPLRGKTKVYVEGFEASVAGRYGTVTAEVKEADVAILKVSAPYEVMSGGTFRAGYHEGTLAYAGAENAKELEAIRRLAGSGKPVVVCMYLDRPAILTEFLGDVAAVLGHFNSGDEALLDVIFGKAGAEGKLPFDLPRDMASVKKQKADVPFDVENPLFRHGFGLRYGK